LDRQVLIAGELDLVRQFQQVASADARTSAANRRLRNRTVLIILPSTRSYCEKSRGLCKVPPAWVKRTRTGKANPVTWKRSAPEPIALWGRQL
jgi:hypothetical protein